MGAIDSAGGEASADDVARIRAGDSRAFEVLFDAYYHRLCGFAVQYVHESAVAEDLVQDVFTNLWRGRATWQVHTTVRAYLFAAVRNRALNLRAHQAVEQDWEREVVARNEHDPAVAEPADLHLERAEVRSRVRAALASLPERCRLVMQLRWLEQMSYATIAEVMGISEKGVENQLARGLRAMQGMLW